VTDEDGQGDDRLFRSGCQVPFARIRQESAVSGLLAPRKALTGALSEHIIQLYD
jgi:hypothetical protein